MDILKSGRLTWTITDGSLDNDGVNLDGHLLAQADLNLLNQPIRLKTPNLVLHLRPVRYANEEERVEFPTGPVVTPLQILGAIYTYYSIPLTKEELDRLEEEEKGDEMIKEIIDEAREEIRQGNVVPRSTIMSSEIFFEGLDENPDGSFDVVLGS